MKVYYSGYHDNSTPSRICHVLTNDQLRVQFSHSLMLELNISSPESIILNRNGCIFYYATSNITICKHKGKVDVVDMKTIKDGSIVTFLCPFKDGIIAREVFTNETVKVWHISEDGTIVELPTSLNIQKLCIGRSVGALLTKDGTFFMLASLTCELKSLVCRENVILVDVSSLRIIDVKCGKEHVVVLTDTGSVYVIGAGGRGQLGIGHVMLAEQLRKVDLLEPLKIKQIAAGGWHTLVLSESGDIYAWGWNESGQCGVISEDNSLDVNSDNSPKLLFTPSLVDTPLEETFVHISAGARHSAAVSSQGKLYTWGWNGYGQLISVNQCSLQIKPKVIDSLPMEVCTAICEAWSTVVCSCLQLSSCLN